MGITYTGTHASGITYTGTHALGITYTGTHALGITYTETHASRMTSADGREQGPKYTDVQRGESMTTEAYTTGKYNQAGFSFWNSRNNT